MTGDGCEVCRGPKAGSHICDKPTCRDEDDLLPDGPSARPLSEWFMFEADAITKVRYPHLHSTHVEGCFRCDLSRDET